MASRKPRTKKYNPLKNASRMAQHALRGVACAFVTGDDGYAHLIDIKTAQRLRASRVMVGCVENFTYKWSILIAGLGIDIYGKPYIKPEEYIIHDPCYQSDLTEYLNERHGELIDGFNEKQFIGAGWLASPLGHTWTEKEALWTFEQLGAFNRRKDPETGEVFVTDPEEKKVA